MVSFMCEMVWTCQTYIFVKNIYKKDMTMYLLEYIPLFASSSMGCLRAVMSLKVHRNRTTASFSFLMGAMWSNSHNGVSVIGKCHILLYLTIITQIIYST